MLNTSSFSILFNIRLSISSASVTTLACFCFPVQDFFFFLNYVRISPAKVLLNYVPTTSCNTGEHEGGKNHSVALLYNFLITRCCLRLETT